MVSTTKLTQKLSLQQIIIIIHEFHRDASLQTKLHGTLLQIGRTFGEFSL